MSTTCYANECPSMPYNVTFIVKSSGEKVTRGFASPYLAQKFINKLKYSKKCSLISYPIFTWGDYLWKD